MTSIVWKKIPWKSMATVNQHSSKYLILCPRAKANFYRFGTTGCMTDLTESKQWQYHNILIPGKGMISISTTVFTWNSKLPQNITWNYYCTAQHYHVSCPGNHIMMVSHSKMMVMMCSRYWLMTAVLLLLWKLLEDRDSMFVPLRDTGVSRELSVL